jgi:transposase-like protein
MKLLHRAYLDAAQRARLLAAFERSGLSAAAFARQHGLNYTTFCGWRKRAERSPAFVQVELPATAAPALVVELGATARLRLTDAAQIPLAVALLQSLQNT